MPDWLQVVLASAAVAVSYLQYRMERATAKAYLVEQHLAVFDAILDFLGPIFRNAKPDIDKLPKLHKARIMARFFCSPEIESHVKSLIEKSSVWAAHLELMKESEPAGELHRKKAKEIEQWFFEQHPVVENHFAKLLNPKY